MLVVLASVRNFALVKKAWSRYCVELARAKSTNISKARLKLVFNKKLKLKSHRAVQYSRVKLAVSPGTKKSKISCWDECSLMKLSMHKRSNII